MADAPEFDTKLTNWHEFNSGYFTATTNESWEHWRLAGEWIGSLSCFQPAGRRRSQERKIMVAGTNRPRLTAANFQMMTFGFESARLSVNENG
jgi:hypothetical protein